VRNGEVSRRMKTNKTAPMARPGAVADSMPLGHPPPVSVIVRLQPDRRLVHVRNDRNANQGVRYRTSKAK